MRQICLNFIHCTCAKGKSWGDFTCRPTIYFSGGSGRNGAPIPPVFISYFNLTTFANLNKHAAQNPLQFVGQYYGSKTHGFSPSISIRGVPCSKINSSQTENCCRPPIPITFAKLNKHAAPIFPGNAVSSQLV